ncbi:MAG: response regulator transcription factor [Streptomycetaceae bacterium]|nr:response regulator transcription factor [Streptomycetaceae bacterium]
MDSNLEPGPERSSDGAARVLVVDAAPETRELLASGLRLAGFRTDAAGGGAAALRMATLREPDLVVVDAALPGSDLSGFDVVRRLRAERPRLPLVVLSARDAVAALAAGADDCLAKPVDLAELVARVNAVLRRADPARAADRAPEARRIVVADLELDPGSHQAARGGLVVSLSPTESRLLQYLMANRGRVVSKAELLDRVWRNDFGGRVNVVESYISYLRRKVDSLGTRLIHTVRGVGYVLR